MTSFSSLHRLYQIPSEYQSERAAIIESLRETASLPLNSARLFNNISLQTLRHCFNFYDERNAVLAFLYWGYDLGTSTADDLRFSEEKAMELVEYCQPYQHTIGRQMLLHILHSVHISHANFRHSSLLSLNDADRADFKTTLHSLITVYLTKRTPEWEDKENDNWYVHGAGANCWVEVGAYFPFPTSELVDLLIEHAGRHDDIADYLNARNLSIASVDPIALSEYLNSDSSALSGGLL